MLSKESQTPPIENLRKRPAFPKLKSLACWKRRGGRSKVEEHGSLLRQKLLASRVWVWIQTKDQFLEMTGRRIPSSNRLTGAAYWRGLLARLTVAADRRIGFFNLPSGKWTPSGDASKFVPSLSQVCPKFVPKHKNRCF